MKTKINGATWTVESASPKRMLQERSDGDVLGGLCISDKKTILIASDSIEYDVVAHELYHAYFSNLYLSQTNNISVEDFEEIAAEMFCKQGEEIVRKAKRILKRLQKGK